MRLIASGSRVGIVAQDPDHATGRLGEPEQHQDGRRLAGAVRAQQPEHLAGLDREVEVVDGRDRAVLLGQAPGGDDGVVGHVGQQRRHGAAPPPCGSARRRACRAPRPPRAERAVRRPPRSSRPSGRSSPRWARALRRAPAGRSGPRGDEARRRLRPDGRRTGVSARRSSSYRRPYVRKTQYRPAKVATIRTTPTIHHTWGVSTRDADRDVAVGLLALGR